MIRRSLGEAVNGIDKKFGARVPALAVYGAQLFDVGWMTQQRDQGLDVVLQYGLNVSKVTAWQRLCDVINNCASYFSLEAGRTIVDCQSQSFGTGY